jgi:hypothetical protein
VAFQILHDHVLTEAEGLQSIELDTCTCNPAPHQLLSRGLFACAPAAPTLAVDLNVLDFAREMFLRVPPNNTAWCETLESFLEQRRYKLTTRVNIHVGHTLSRIINLLAQNSLRRRFGSALQWYSSLVHATDKYVQDIIETVRFAVVSSAPEANRGMQRCLQSLCRYFLFRMQETTQSHPQDIQRNLQGEVRFTMSCPYFLFSTISPRPQALAAVFKAK